MPPPFDIAYSLLNSQQKLAVDTIDGPVMVIAGPGTGKTQVLTTRIANILKQTDTTPDSILALTFTDSGAKAMRERLLALIGPTAYRLHISTFHSFCQDLINTYPDYFIIGNNPSPLSDLDRLQLIKKILTASRFEILKPLNAPDLYLSAITSSIQILKREGVSPADFSRLLKDELKFLEAQQDSLTPNQFTTLQKALQKNIELQVVYLEYQKATKALGRYDFEDMINFVTDKFETDPEFLTAIQEKYQYLLVDEYQDTNSSQNKLLKYLSSYFADSPNLFVVLDDEQSIFRFQGASLENALDFLDRYPKAKVITLSDNYRSGQNILDAARSLIENNTHNLQHRLPDLSRRLSSRVGFPVEPVSEVVVENGELETQFILKEIKKLLASGTSPSEIAIIVRNNADLKFLAETLSRNSLPFVSSSPREVLDSLPVKYLIRILKAIDHSRLAIDDLDLFTILNFPFFNLNTLEILKSSRAASVNQTTLFDNISHEQSPLRPFLDTLLSWNALASTRTFAEFVQHVITDSKLLDWVIESPQVSEYLPDLNSFFEFIKRQNQAQPDLNLADFLSMLDLISANHLPLNGSDMTQSSEKIILTTAHKAKGLEWECVFIAKCIDGYWGNQTSRSLIKLPSSILKKEKDEHLLEDERRLFYVALTRAKKHLYLTRAENYSLTGKPKQGLPSQFLTELPSDLLHRISPKFSSAEITTLLQSGLSPTTELSQSEAELLTSVLTDYRLSVTALNTFLTCAYKFKLADLFKVPKTKEVYLSFGTAIHSALQKFHQRLKAPTLRSELNGKQYLLKQFEIALKNETLTPSDFTDRLHYGKQVLSSYFDFFEKEFTAPLFTERKFGSTDNPVLLGDIPLTGKIDRLDQTRDGIRVVDYKTGGRKTRGEIEGTTQNSNGDIKRQLVFYELLTSLDHQFPHKMVEAQIDFVESPHKDHKSGRELFKVKKEEVEELKQVIKDSMKQIRALNFPRTSDHRNCERCDFRDHCWPDGIPSGTDPVGR